MQPVDYWDENWWVKVCFLFDCACGSCLHRFFMSLTIGQRTRVPHHTHTHTANSTTITTTNTINNSNTIDDKNGKDNSKNDSNINNNNNNSEETKTKTWSFCSRFWRCIAAPSPDGPRYSQGILRQLISTSLRGGWETVGVILRQIWWVFVGFDGELPDLFLFTPKMAEDYLAEHFFQMGVLKNHLSEGCSVWLPHQLAVLDSRWWVINYPKHLDDLHGPWLAP